MLSQQTKEQSKVKFITTVGMLSAISIVLYFIAEIPIIPIAPHLKLDLSDIPALVGGILIGPVAGLAVEMIKNILHLLRSSTFGIGEIVNCVVGIGLVVPFSIVFHKMQGRHGFWKAYGVSSLVSLVSIVVVGIIINAILYPIFMALLGQAIASTEVFIAYLWSTVLMNAIKWAVNMIPAMFFIKPLLKIK